MTGEKKKKKVKVTDKRKFDADGKPRETAEAEEKEEPRVESPDEEKELDEEATLSEGELPEEVTFAAFLLSLGNQAMVHLGLIPDPIDGEVKASLPLAKQMIDIISMLREKTRGNLEAFELTMLDNMLFELRMKFVELSKEQ